MQFNLTVPDYGTQKLERIIGYGNPELFRILNGRYSNLYRWDVWNYTKTPPDDLNISHLHIVYSMTAFLAYENDCVKITCHIGARFLVCPVKLNFKNNIESIGMWLVFIAFCHIGASFLIQKIAQ